MLMLMWLSGSPFWVVCMGVGDKVLIRWFVVERVVRELPLVGFGFGL